ncbi:MAG TPA: hypothetical protein PLC99_14610 [Verrucomicrobiota bacterium]|nr:hypothetical protein [Verrucomicrobiota bacterium]
MKRKYTKREDVNELLAEREDYARAIDVIDDQLGARKFKGKPDIRAGIVWSFRKRYGRWRGLKAKDIAECMSLNLYRNYSLSAVAREALTQELHTELHCMVMDGELVAKPLNYFVLPR